MEDELTTLLQASLQEEPQARNTLRERTYVELLHVAEKATRRSRSALDPASLLHEAWVKLEGARCRPREGEHLKALLCKGMRQLLTDRARATGARKRGGDWRRVTLTSQLLSPTATFGLKEYVDVFERLEARAPRLRQVAEMHVAGKMTHAAVAAELGISVSTVEGDWATARALLFGWLCPRGSEKP